MIMGNFLQLLLKVEKAFSTLLKTFQSSKTVPQSGSLRCGGTEKSQAWEQGQQIMAIMQPVSVLQVDLFIIISDL